MEFLPMPHQLSKGEGAFRLRWDTPIVLRDTEPSALLWAEMLQAEIRRGAGLDLRILRGDALPGCLLLTVSGDLPQDHYTLKITGAGVSVTGGSDEALLHGVTTLNQWIRRHGAILPALTIEDWPDLPHRGYYLDCSRGRVPTLEILKRTVDLLCRYKINEFQLYIEHTYLFRDLSEAWRDDDPLEAEDILALDAYCRARHIELVPSLATFGHMYQILSTKTCAELCERRDSEKIPFSYTYAIHRHTMNCTHPGALDFIKGLISEYRTLFTSRRFNICCDETFDLCCDRGAAQAEKEGAQTLYVRYLSELCRWLMAQGVTPMYWGDVLSVQPDCYDQLPKGGICLSWGYAPDQPEDDIRALAAMGATQYTCPGVCNWGHLLPRLADSFSNIRAMCRHAHRYGAIGMLNTDWGDWGHMCQTCFSTPGVLYGAAFSWNAEERPMEELNAAISFLEYGDRTGDFLRAFAGLTDQDAFIWADAVRWIEAGGEARQAVLREALPRILTAPERNARLEEALLLLDRAAPALDAESRPILHALQVSAEGVRLFNLMGLHIAGQGAADPIDLASRLEKWYHEYLRVWRTMSRQGTMERTRRLIDAWADVLRGREYFA